MSANRSRNASSLGHAGPRSAGAQPVHAAPVRGPQRLGRARVEVVAEQVVPRGVEDVGRSARGRPRGAAEVRRPSRRSRRAGRAAGATLRGLHAQQRVAPLDLRVGEHRQRGDRAGEGRGQGAQPSSSTRGLATGSPAVTRSPDGHEQLETSAGQAARTATPSSRVTRVGDTVDLEAESPVLGHRDDRRCPAGDGDPPLEGAERVDHDVERARRRGRGRCRGRSGPRAAGTGRRGTPGGWRADVLGVLGAAPLGAGPERRAGRARGRPRRPRPPRPRGPPGRARARRRPRRAGRRTTAGQAGPR